MLDKAQFSVAKSILECPETKSSFNDVLTDVNLTRLHLRREISLRRYLSKLIFVIWCPATFPIAFPDRSKNSFLMIYYFKNPWPLNFFCKVFRLWNSLPLASDLQPGTLFSWIAWILIFKKHPSPNGNRSSLDIYTLCASLRPQPVVYHQKYSYHVRVCGAIETEVYLFHCKVHSTACTVLYKVRGILTECGLAECFGLR